jgi:hypothetical protein
LEYLSVSARLDGGFEEAEYFRLASCLFCSALWDKLEGLGLAAHRWTNFDVLDWHDIVPTNHERRFDSLGFRGQTTMGSALQG